MEFKMLKIELLILKDWMGTATKTEGEATVVNGKEGTDSALNSLYGVLM